MNHFAFLELPEPRWQPSPKRNAKTCEAASAGEPKPSSLLDGSNDIYEVEADRIADEVARNPATLPAVHGRSVRNADGLDKATLEFMQTNLGRDFRDVRIHTDGSAASKASALQARAITTGRDLFFGAGEYAPATREGRRLIAHELVHVMQQANLPGGLNRPSAQPSGTIMMQRAPDKKGGSGRGVPAHLLLHSRAASLEGLDRDQRIKILAANPDHAAYEWKRLSLTDQTAVLVTMAQFYGDAFAKEFAAQRNARKKPGYGYTNASIEPAILIKSGYRRAGIQQQLEVEVWFRPSGDRFHRTIGTGSSKQPERSQAPTPEKEAKDVDSPVEPPIDCDDTEEEAQSILQAMDGEMDELEKIVEPEFKDGSRYTEGEGDFGELRESLAELMKQCGSELDDDVRSSIIQQRKELVERLLKARSKFYGSDQTDWAPPPSERD